MKNLYHTSTSAPKGKDPLGLGDKFRKNTGDYNNKTHDKITSQTNSQAHQQELNSKIKRVNKDRKFYFMALIFIFIICMTVFAALMLHKPSGSVDVDESAINRQ